MSLGKRPRGPMKRTISMSEITLDLNKSTDVVDPSNHQYPFNRERPLLIGVGVGVGGFNNNNNHSNNSGVDHQSQIHQSTGVLATATVSSPRIQRRHSGGDFVEAPDFLRACSLCKRRLVPGRDIYMYRGDSAFCSLECRQKQMNRDERKDKFLVSSKKQVVTPPICVSSHHQR